MNRGHGMTEWFRRFGRTWLLLWMWSGLLTLSAGAQVSLPYPQGTAFPLMMYEVNNPPTNAAAYTNYGWNIFQSYGLKTNADINTFLASALKANVTADVVIPESLDTNGTVVEWTQTAVQNWIAGSGTNTNIAWWDLPEEMRWWVAGEMQLLIDYTARAHQFDTAHRPTYEYTPNNRTDTDISHTAPGADVLGISCYCESQGMPHAWVRYKLQQSGRHGVALAGETLGSNYLLGQKTLIGVLYCATNSTGNVATPAQCYHDAWSAIASGAQGLALFAYWHAIHDTPPLTNNLQQYNLAAAQLSGAEQIGQVVLYGLPNTNVTFTVTAGPTNTVVFSPPGATNIVYPSLNLLCKTWSNKVYVIAVNSTSNTVAATIANLPVLTGTAVLPFETNAVAITNASLADTFAPWGVHVYKVTPPAPALAGSVLGGGRVALGFSGIANFSYVLQRSTNLFNEAGWLDVATNVPAQPGTVLFTNSAGGNAVFYRVRIR